MREIPQLPPLANPEPTEFSLHYAAYCAAVETYETHWSTHRPADDSPLWFAYENSYTALVSAMHEAGIEAIKAPAISTEEVIAKVMIFGVQDYSSCERDLRKQLTDILVADALRLGGAA